MRDDFTLDVAVAGWETEVVAMRPAGLGIQRGDVHRRKTTDFPISELHDRFTYVAKLVDGSGRGPISLEGDG